MNQDEAKRLFILLLICCYTPLIAQKHFTLTPALIDLYHQAWEFDAETSTKLIDKIQMEDPDNLLLLHFLNYQDFVRLITGQSDLKPTEFYKVVDQHIERMKAGPKDTPYFYFSQAELYVQRALVKSKNEQYIRAGWDINKANKLLGKCRTDFPDFQVATKSLSVIQTIAGSVKGFRRTMMKMLTSLDGTIPEGLVEIQRLYEWNLDHSTIWSDEIITIRALITGHIERDWDLAYEIMNQLGIQKRHTTLGIYLLSWTAGKANRNETVLQLLWVEEGVNQGLPVFDYLYGKALLQAMNVNANGYLLSFIEKNKEGEYVGAACQQMAWFSLIMEDNITGYKYWMGRVLELKKTQNIEDRLASQEAKSGIIPNLDLLKSRLLFDGGYYEQSLAVLKKKQLQGDGSEKTLEAIYREGRIMQQMNRYDEALSSFAKALDIGRESKSYFACNAALQTARIHFLHKDYIKAYRYAQLSLAINPAEHKKSLHQEATILRERSELGL